MQQNLAKNAAWIIIELSFGSLIELLIMSVSTSKFFLSLAALAGVMAMAAPACAETSAMPGNYALQQAMSSDDTVNLYTPGKTKGEGFSLSGNFFSGVTSGSEPLAKYTSPSDAYNFSQASAMEGDQRVYALLIDGSYDFNYDFGSGLPLHPYLRGGAGMAMADPSANAGAFALQGGEVVPLFRVGGGVTYRLGEQWNLSLDYKAGFSSSMTGGDQVFTTGRSQQAVDLQTLNMGMRYSF
jgi:hypothetical protein